MHVGLYRCVPHTLQQHAFEINICQRSTDAERLDGS